MFRQTSVVLQLHLTSSQTRVVRRGRGTALALAVVVVSTACVDELPTAPTSRVAAARPHLSVGGFAPAPRSLDDHFTDLARMLPGFGGAYEDGDSLAVVLTSTASTQVAREIVPAFLRSHKVEMFERGSAKPVRIVHGTFDFLELKSRFDRITQNGWPLNATALDIDERANRVLVGVQTAAEIGPMLEALRSTGVLDSAVIVSVLEAPRPAQVTLWSERRPVLAGIQISVRYTNTTNLCTLGYNVHRYVSGSVDWTRRYILTNSHCTGVRWAKDSSAFYQPSVPIDLGDSIATEVDDVPLFTGSPCPAGKQCRWSDAALAEYRSSISWFLGGVAASSATVPPAAPPWSGYWIFRNDGSTWNQTEYKTGRTTGTTSGSITHSCYDFNFGGPGSGIVLKCQYRVAAAAGSGDSGSPVYRTDYWVGWYVLWPTGILHSGDSTQFVFSPISGIHQDLGSLYYYASCSIIEMTCPWYWDF